MSPLARIRQATACSALIGCWAVAAAQGVESAAPAQSAAAPSAARTSPPPVPSATQPLSPSVPSAARPLPPSSPTPATATVAAAAAPAPVQLAPNVTAVIAHSALLTIEGTAKPDALQISIRRVSDKSLVNNDDVTVAIDGRNQSVTRERGTVYEVPINDLRGNGARDVDITVAHDGIREIVSGKVTVAEASTESLWRDHKQVAWWVLNIVIVLVAALAFSGRKSKTEDEAEE